MIQFDRLDLLEEKLKLLKGLNSSIVRTFALAVFIVACLKSSLPIELKLMAIAGLVFACVMLTALIQTFATLGTLQSESNNLAQLSMITLEAMRRSPADARPALEIQAEVEAHARKTTDYRLGQGDFAEALAAHAVQTALALATIVLAAVVTWYYWTPALRIVERLAVSLN